MNLRFSAALVAASLLLPGCARDSQTQIVNGCPTPVHYTDAQIKEITHALEALPANNILHQAMRDYEYERDDLRFCRCTVAEGGKLPQQ